MRRLLTPRAGLALLAFGALLTATAWWDAGRSAGPLPEASQAERPAPPELTHSDPSAAGSAAESDNRLRILGTWQDRYKGRRTMTLRDDGTATMVCELEGLNARLFTPVLDLELQWQLKDGVMTRVITGGEPADKVRFVVNLMGARSDETLLKLTDTELHLLDADGETEYHWTRKPLPLTDEVPQ